MLPSSTNPTRPYTVNTIDEHLDMLMVCHHLDPAIAEDVAFAESRIRARDDRRRRHPARPRRVLDDVVGLAGDGPRRRSDHPHLADRAQDEGAARRACPSDSARNDNFRVKRYIAKYTINPAITHGIAHDVGSIEAGKLADLVLWKPAFFGVKPSLILKGGMIAAAAMGDPNASIPTPQPVHYRPMFGAFGGALSKRRSRSSRKAALKTRHRRQLGLSKQLVAVKNTRKITQEGHDAQRRDARRSNVDPETYEVRADGELLACEPAHCAADGAALFPVLTMRTIDKRLTARSHRHASSRPR